MHNKSLGARRTHLWASSAIAVLFATAAHAAAGAAATAEAADDSTSVSELVVTGAHSTRSTTALETETIQKVLPGVSPLKAIQTLPGVLYETADPWGNNEQNVSLFVHGFSTQQLGYTMDGVPLGDQQYGNYNGLSVSRAVISENVDRVALSSGAGSLGVASTSNLGGAIETYSRDPAHAFGGTVRQTVGAYDAFRTFLRVDSGDLDQGRFYVSYLH
ncbi:MAG TPA: Plug domain-containing protein, partial [Phenylobacterium sp.]|nr:Plug domain-containing protein [Phenylobacterium sp.]